MVDEIHTRSGLSRTRIKDAMTKGAVWLRKKKGKPRRSRRARASCSIGDEISIYFNRQILGTLPPVPTLIEDREHYSVWYKPAGLLSSGSRYGDHCSINRWVEKSWHRPVFLIHRLDRFATGLMVLAHTKKSATHLSAQFRERKVTKIYKAIVQAGEPGEELFSAGFNTFTINESLDGKVAISHITPLATSQGRSLLSVRIETGRKHQIRRHLSGAGFPILGDRQYGGADYPGMQLTAIALSFTCPLRELPCHYELPQVNHPALEKLDD